MKKAAKIRQLVPLVVDVLAPVLTYYLLHALGIGDAVALGAAALIPGTSTGVKLLKNGKLDQLGLFMTLLLVVGVVLVFVTGDPRLLLIKPALFVMLGGVFCFVSLLGERPFMMTIAKPMATGGDAGLERLWEDSLHTSASFRAAIRTSTAVFGAALLVDAIGRIVVVYSTPVATAVALANAPGIAAIALAIVYHLKTVKPVFHSIKEQSGLAQRG